MSRVVIWGQSPNNFKGESEEMTIDADETEIYKFGIGKVGETKGTYTLVITVK